MVVGYADHRLKLFSARNITEVESNFISTAFCAMLTLCATILGLYTGTEQFIQPAQHCAQ